MAKSFCSITREQFRSGAKALPVTVGGASMLAEPKEFSTGSLGWYLNGKTVVEINGVSVTVQIGMNMTIVGSKELPKDGESPKDGE